MPRSRKKSASLKVRCKNEWIRVHKSVSGVQESPRGAEITSDGQVKFFDPGNPDGLQWTATTSVNDRTTQKEGMAVPSQKPDKQLIVSDIAEYSFCGLPELQKVVLPYTLLHIGVAAFAQTNVSEVNFPPAIITVGRNAFHNTPLTDVKLPLSVTEVGENAFPRRAEICGGAPELGYMRCEDTATGAYTWANQKSFAEKMIYDMKTGQVVKFDRQGQARTIAAGEIPVEDWPNWKEREQQLTHKERTDGRWQKREKAD